MTAKSQPPELLQFVCNENDVGQRLDQFLAERVQQSRSQIKRLIDDQMVVVNGKSVKAGYRLKLTDEIMVTIPAPTPIELEPEALDIEIIYQDADLAVINKPAGLVVHPGAGNWQHTLVNALLYHCPDLSGIGGKLRPGIVHRLDKDTSGVMVIAKNDAAHQYLAQQIKARKVKRHYLALVHGTITAEQGRIEASIGRHPVERKKMAIREDGREAITQFFVRERIGKAYSLVECHLLTGRTHQIRVHMAGINHPIVGDPVYGRKHGNLGAARQMLHAFYLGFVHPSQQWMEFQVDLPADFQETLMLARQYGGRVVDVSKEDSDYGS